MSEQEEDISAKRKSIYTVVMHEELAEAYEMLGTVKAKLSKIAKLLDGLEVEIE